MEAAGQRDRRRKISALSASGSTIINYSTLRQDWFANGNFMARALQRQLRARQPIATYGGFPRHWLPLFAWVGAHWCGSIEPPNYIPLISGRSESDIVAEIETARANGQLRLLVELVASAEVVLCETLQRIDGRLAERDFKEEKDKQVILTTWHGYNRADVRAIDAVIADFKQTRPGVMFIPCAKARPYQNSQGYQRLMRRAAQFGLDMDGLDKIVITSLGPVPEPYWEHDLVQRYDTGVRDIYRLLVQTRALLKRTDYKTAWDLMGFVPYSDMLRMLHLEGYIPEPKKLASIRRRNIPSYRTTRVAR